MPDISGKFGISGCTDGYGGYANGAFLFEIRGTARGATTSGAGDFAVDFMASRSHDIYGAADTVQPPSIALLAQIRF